jgi:hypothetical protein
VPVLPLEQLPLPALVVVHLRLRLLEAARLPRNKRSDFNYRPSRVPVVHPPQLLPVVPLPQLPLVAPHLLPVVAAVPNKPYAYSSPRNRAAVVQLPLVAVAVAPSKPSVCKCPPKVVAVVVVLSKRFD